MRGEKTKEFNGAWAENGLEAFWPRFLVMQRSTDLCRNKHQFYRTAVYSRTHWRFATDETCVYSRLKSAIIKQAPSKIARHQAIYVNVSVNVEFKVTLHEQVRYRGTLQY